MATDLSNWEQSSSDVNVYNRESSVSIDHEKRRDAKRQDIRVQTNISNGNYTIFATGTKELGLQGNASGQDIEIFSYDAQNNQYSIKDSVYMDSLFSDKLEGDSRTKFFENFNSEIRIDTYNITKSESNTAVGEKRLETIEKYKGYQSAKNQSTQSPQTITNGAKSNNNSSGSTTSPRSSTKQQLRSTPNTDILNPPDNRAFSLQPTQLSSTDNIANFNYMRYPEGRVPNLGYDYIQITAYKYEPVGVPAAYNTTRKSAEDRLYKDPGDVIQFPMTGSISETNAVNWTDDTVSEIQNIAAGIALNRISEASNPFGAVAGAFMDVLKSGQEAFKDEDIQKAIAAYFAGQAAGVPNILQRAEGKMINNNLELLFNGPSLRSFNFSFQLRPRTKSEASLIRAIIRSLKKNSAPKRSADFMFLETPSIFRIQYIYNTDTPDLADSASVLTGSQKEHPYMNKIKPCALTGLNVNYTPEGSYMTYEDGGSMTGYDLNLTFKEIEPIYADDHELTPSESMGY